MAAPWAVSTSQVRSCKNPVYHLLETVSTEAHSYDEGGTYYRQSQVVYKAHWKDMGSWDIDFPFSINFFLI